MEQLTKDIKSLDSWSRIMRANTIYQNKGLLQIDISLQEIINKEDLPKVKLLELTFLIKYEVTKPAAGLKFHTLESEADQKSRICVYNENKV
jgi:hypothetical protein